MTSDAGQGTNDYNDDNNDDDDCLQIVFSKLRSQTAMDHDRRHLKAAKALVIVIPLFGFTYLLTIIGPSKVESQLLVDRGFLFVKIVTNVSHNPSRPSFNLNGS